MTFPPVCVASSRRWVPKTQDCLTMDLTHTVPFPRWLGNSVLVVEEVVVSVVPRHRVPRHAPHLVRFPVRLPPKPNPPRLRLPSRVPSRLRSPAAVAACFPESAVPLRKEWPLEPGPPLRTAPWVPSLEALVAVKPPPRNQTWRPAWTRRQRTLRPSKEPVRRTRPCSTNASSTTRATSKPATFCMNSYSSASRDKTKCSLVRLERSGTWAGPFVTVESRTRTPGCVPKYPILQLVVKSNYC